MKKILFVILIAVVFLNVNSGSLCGAEINWTLLTKGLEIVKDINKYVYQFQVDTEYIYPTSLDKRFLIEVNLAATIFQDYNITLKWNILQKKKIIPQMTFGGSYWNMALLPIGGAIFNVVAKKIPVFGGSAELNAMAQGFGLFYTVSKTFKGKVLILALHFLHT